MSKKLFDSCGVQRCIASGEFRNPEYRDRELRRDNRNSNVVAPREARNYRESFGQVLKLE